MTEIDVFRCGSQYGESRNELERPGSSRSRSALSGRPASDYDPTMRARMIFGLVLVTALLAFHAGCGQHGLREAQAPASRTGSASAIATGTSPLARAPLFTNATHALVVGILAFDDPSLLPEGETALWFLVSRMRQAVTNGELCPPPPAGEDATRYYESYARKVNALLAALPEEYRLALLLDRVEQWANLGASEAMLSTLKEVTGL